MTLRVGLLGSIDHIGLFADEATQREDIDFVGIAEPDAEKGAALAGKYSTQHFPTAEGLLEQELDAVGIFTPFAHKAEDITTCLERGLHVFADKPAAANNEGLERLAAAVKAHPELTFTVGLTLRVIPEYVRLRELVKDGAIGELVYATARRAYRMRRETRPDFMFDSSLSGGIWVELAVHDVDYVRWLAGVDYLSVSAIHGNASSPEEPFQDHGCGLFRLEGGVTALIEHNRLAPNVGASADNRFSAVGTEGVLDMAPGGGLYLWNGSTERTRVTDLPERASMLANFVDAIREGTPLIVPPADVLRATEVVLAAFASSEEEGKQRPL